MPQQVGKFDFSGIPAADFSGIPKAVNQTTVSAEDFVPATGPEGSALGRFASNAGEMLNPLTILQGLFQAVRHPIDTTSNIIGAQVDQGKQAIDMAQQGRYSEMVGHGAAALLPLFGPIAAQAGEQIGAGDIAGGMGKAAGVLAPMGIPTAARMARASGATPKVGAALEQSANADVSKALNPTRHRTKVKTERIAPEVRKRGITGDLEDVRELAKSQRAAVGDDIDTALSALAANPVNIQPVKAALARESASTYNLVKQANGTTKKVVHDPRKAAQIEKVRAVLDKYGATMTTEQAVAIRQTWDKIVAKAGGFDEKAGNQFGTTLDDASEAGVKRPLASAMRKELAKANPSVAALNKEFGFWADLDDVASATSSRQVGQKRNLTKQIMRGGTMAAGAASGSGIPGAIIAGEVAARLEGLFASTKWKLASAQVKTKLADALASGQSDRIASAIGRATAALTATNPSGSQRGPAPASPPLPSPR